MIDPDFFGCSGKLPYDETRRLAATAGDGAGGDFAEFACEGAMVSSIDRIHRCVREWDRFARIALNHAFGDVVCAGAAPVQAMLSFEFGVDAEETDHSDCSAAFARELAARGVALGKCHSGRSAGVTAVTVAVLAAGAKRLRPVLTRGYVYLSRPIGALKLLYLSELGIPVNVGYPIDLLERPRDASFHAARWTLVTDVSGHGLLGTLVQTAVTHGVDVDLALSEKHVASPDVLAVPVECLQNPLGSYGLPLEGVDPRALALATLRETAGPFLGFMEDGIDNADLAGVGLPVGRYFAGDGRVDLAWIG